MKKLLMCMIIVTTLLVPSLTFADAESFELNGKIVNKDLKVNFNDNRMMFLSLNTIAKELGYNVEADNSTKMVTISKEKEKFTFYLEGAIQKDEKVPILKDSKIVDGEILLSAPIMSYLFNGNAEIISGKLKITAKGPIKPINYVNTNKKLTNEEKEKYLIRTKGKIVSMDVRNIFGMDEVLHLSVKIGDRNMYFYLLGVNKGPSITQKQLDEFMSEYIGKELDFVIDRSYFGKQIQMITGNHFAGYIYSGDKMLNAELIKSGLYALDETNADIILLDDIKEMVKPADNTNLKGINNTTVIKNK